MTKRIFDLSILFILSPILIALIAVVYFFCLVINSKSIFFFQDRGGYLGRKIKIIKFRTIDNNDKHISKFNNFLRKTKLDELPQFYNILKGDLSLVGPRPLHFEYKKLYNKKQKKRFLQKPGITGLAQIQSGDSMSWSKQFEIDIEYCENCTLILDVEILIKTIVYLLKSLFLKKKNTNNKKKFNGLN